MSQGKPFNTSSAGGFGKQTGQGPVPLSAREAALKVLEELGSRPGSAREAIDSLVKGRLLEEQERALTTELVMGVLRHRLTMGRVLGNFTTRGWKHVQKRVRHILMIAAYQLIWLDGIPQFAAVDEAVKQAKRDVGIRGSKFVNAVLRQMLREIECRRLPAVQAVAERAVPIDNQFSCQFLQPVMPDPVTKLAEYLSCTTSHPLWLVSRWISNFGVETAGNICRAGIFQPPIFLRPNPLKTDLGGLLTRLESEGVSAEPTLDNEALVILQSPPIAKLRSFVDGLFQPQDPTAMSVVRQMSILPGQVVLDLCAGLGTKSTQMAEVMKNSGMVLACDKFDEKLVMIGQNCARLGCTVVKTVLASEIKETVFELPDMDWILVDVPCSNSGVLARRAEARYRIDRRSLDALSELQFSLLTLAADIAGQRTRLIYSTCSLEPEENEQIITRFAETHHDWRLSASQRTFPCSGPSLAEWRDGGYWAMWVRK